MKFFFSVWSFFKQRTLYFLLTIYQIHELRRVALLSELQTKHSSKPSQWTDTMLLTSYIKVQQKATFPYSDYYWQLEKVIFHQRFEKVQGHVPLHLTNKTIHVKIETVIRGRILTLTFTDHIIHSPPHNCDKVLPRQKKMFTRCKILSNTALVLRYVSSWKDKVDRRPKTVIVFPLLFS